MNKQIKREQYNNEIYYYTLVLFFFCEFQRIFLHVKRCTKQMLCIDFKIPCKEYSAHLNIFININNCILLYILNFIYYLTNSIPIPIQNSRHFAAFFLCFVYLVFCVDFQQKQYKTNNNNRAQPSTTVDIRRVGVAQPLLLLLFSCRGFCLFINNGKTKQKKIWFNFYAITFKSLQPSIELLSVHINYDYCKPLTP